MLKALKPARALASGYIVIIFLGSALLCLPISSRSEISFLSALFTSTSATCVTGLAVLDTYTAFTGFGQAVLLALIQIGGLGFMTVAAVFSMVAGRKIGLRERSMLMESVSASQLGGVVSLIRRVVLTTLSVELLGAVALSFSFVPRFGWGQGIWFSVFHSISAFCNAGFDLMGCIEPYSSLTAFRGDAVVNITVVMLILTGGIGFLVWDDVRLHGFRVRKYRLHSKLMLTSTLVLVLLPAVGFFVLENDASFAELSLGEQALASLFHAVTPRTAGFNTVDINAFSSGGYALTSVLMVIGGGAGSTAGGMKVTTFAVLIMSLFAYARGRDDVCAYSRRLDEKRLRTAYMSAAMYALMAFTGFFALCCSQPSIQLKDALFEALSAVGTVGMSTGVTRELNTTSRIIVMALMYVGRVGTLSFLMALTNPRKQAKVRYPEEEIIV